MQSHCRMAMLKKKNRKMFIFFFLFLQVLRVGWSASRSRHSSRTTAGNLRGLFLLFLFFFLSNAGHAGFLDRSRAQLAAFIDSQKETNEIILSETIKKKEKE